MLEVATNKVNQMLTKLPYLEVVKASCVEGSNYSQMTFVLRVSNPKKGQWFQLIQELLRATTDNWQPYVAQRYLIIDNELRYRWELVFKVVNEDEFIAAMAAIVGSKTPEGVQNIQKIPLPWVPKGDRNVPGKDGRGVYKIGSMGDMGKMGLSED